MQLDQPTSMRLTKAVFDSNICANDDIKITDSTMTFIVHDTVNDISETNEIDTAHFLG